MTTVIIGAGAGGLAAAIALAAKGQAVTVLEAQSGAGGKLLPVHVGGSQFDSGPTVLTMRWVFEELFQRGGENLADNLSLQPLHTLARHYWSGGQMLDLFANGDETADAIGSFAGLAEARGYQAFAKAAKRIHNSLLQPFLKSQRPTPWSLAAAMPLADLFGINPFQTYWNALAHYFKDQRLQQLFGRYATYCGSSPFQAPATLMLVADVEASGVWRVEGGMAELALAMENLARKSGVEFLFNRSAKQIETTSSRVSAVIDNEGNRHPCTSVIFNGDSTALADGLLGDAFKKTGAKPSAQNQSLSAFTWCATTQESGAKLEHHTVFFSDDYKNEFAALQTGPALDPTVYMCDQGQGRKLILTNAPAKAQVFSDEIETNMLRRLEKSGLTMTLQNVFRRSPQDFATLYPATSGALYGRASHGWMATFQRPQARTKIPGLYLAGGSTHPGPGVPMAALAGMRAAEALLQDRGLMRP